MSYFYRPAVDMAVIARRTGKLAGKTDLALFEHPASQMVFFERLGFHSRATQEGWVPGVRFICAYLDGHVDLRRPDAATAAGLPAIELPDEVGPDLQRALMQPGWPCWFNYDAKTGKRVRARAWDPARYRDDLD